MVKHGAIVSREFLEYYNKNAMKAALRTAGTHPTIIGILNPRSVEFPRVYSWVKERLLYSDAKRKGQDPMPHAHKARDLEGKLPSKLNQGDIKSLKANIEFLYQEAVQLASQPTPGIGYGYVDAFISIYVATFDSWSAVSM